MRRLRIGLVTTYPPTQGRLSEYGWHLARTLKRSPRVETVRVFADGAGDRSGMAEDDGDVDRCWTFDGVGFPWRIARAVRSRDFDAIWFNLHLTSTGRRRISRVAALATPALLRGVRYRTIVTLHHLPDLTDLAAASIQATRADRIAAPFVIRLICLASSVCVPLPEYADLLRTRYHAHRVRFIPLGAPGLPPLAGCPRDPNAVLAFGRFGSYKRLDVVLAAVGALHDEGHPVHLHVAGSDSPHTPGYLASLARTYGRAPHVTFHGYVDETRVPWLFQHCAATVLPYRTITGASSVAMQAAMFGTAILAADIPGLRLMSRLGVQMTFAPFDDAGALARQLAALLATPEAHEAQVRANLDYSTRVRMEAVVDEYLDEIEDLISGGRPRQGRMTVETTSSVRS